jgi:hypothetical protein
MESKMSVPALLGGVGELLSECVAPIVVFMVAVSAIGTVIDLTMNGSSGYMMINNVVGLIAGYLLLRAVLLSSALAEPGSVAGFGSYFGLSFVQGLAVVVGVLLLVIPGIVLLVRWIPAAPLLLCEGRGVSDTLSRSWDETKGNFWPLFGTSLLGAVPFLFVAFGAGVVESFAGDGSAGGMAVQLATGFENLVLAGCSVFFCLLGVSAYKLLFREPVDFAEVFA